MFLIEYLLSYLTSESMKPSMKTLFSFFLPILISFPLSAEDLSELIFQDDFERSESQEEKDEPGNGWNTNSKSRAQGDKQVDLKDGTMRIFISPKADHGVSVTQPAEFTDGTVSLRFLLEDKKDSLGLNFADPKFKGVHAGHLFKATIRPDRVELADWKTGIMRKDIRDTKKAGKPLSEEQKQAMVGKTKRIKHKTSVGKWHEVQVTVSGDEFSMKLNGELIGSHKSPGFAHPTKRLLRLAVPRNVVVDDVKIWRKK
jgi:hypothetical protein